MILPSVDLEDNRAECIDDPSALTNRVPILVEKLLGMFEREAVKATFFTVGVTARENKSAIRDIVGAGHEIACHSFAHRTLDQLSEREFREDLDRNLDALESAGATRIHGFRAPCWSVHPKTAWVWDVLADRGFSYSSSVLPSRGVYFGWPEFGAAPRKVNAAIWEIPVNTFALGPLSYPYAGGIYLRSLPNALIRRFARRDLERGRHIVAYLHPYDVDVDQPRFRVNRNPLFNYAMYWGRASVAGKCSQLFGMAPAMTYARFADLLEAQAEGRHRTTTAEPRIAG